MKALIATLSVAAALTFAAPTFAGPNTGQPSAAQRISNMIEHRAETVKPYALTGAKTEAKTEWQAKHVNFGASRHQHLVVRVDAN
ncbi:hypothetical protein HED60_06025 [Planctomycetales bacterium ZRK34]|nr:hypothetical protein HED60_06025 [Planctomycetales bacterium ZRK34]